MHGVQFCVDNVHDLIFIHDIVFNFWIGEKNQNISGWILEVHSKIVLTISILNVNYHDTQAKINFSM